MKTNDVSVKTSAMDTTNIHVDSVHSADIATPTKRTRTSKPKVWKYVLGDVYRLCYAHDRDDAMLAFSTIDHIRVDQCSLNNQFIYSLFNEGSIIQSVYDGRNIFQFTFK